MNRPQIRPFALPALLALLFVGGLSASLSATLPETDPIFRADDGPAWRSGGNPARWGINGTIGSAMVEWAPVDAAGSTVLPAAGAPDALGVGGFLMTTPLGFFGADFRGAATTWQFGGSLGLSRSFSLGWRLSQLDGTAANSAIQDWGLILRPVDLLSLGLTLENAASPNRILGMGLGIRPVALFSDDNAWLTLNADAHIGPRGFVFESAGLKLDIASVVGLQGWWDFVTMRPGASLSLSLAGIATGASLPQIGEPWTDLRAGLSLGVPAVAPELPGKKVLWIKDLSAITTLPSTMMMAMPWSRTKQIDLASLIAMIHRATKRDDVQALVLENLPGPGRLAENQELAAAIDGFKASGKKLLVHANSIGDSVLYQVVLAKADRLSLNPNGQVWLSGQGSTQLFLKGFLDKLGVRFINLAPWDTKSAYNWLSEAGMPEAERQMLQRWQGEIQDQAVAALEANRGSRLSLPARQLLDDGPWLVASKAKMAGLVDEIAYQSDFEESVRKEFPGAMAVTSLADPADKAWGPALTAKQVAVVWLNGTIGDDQGQAGSSIGQSAAQEIARLRQDPFTAALILRVDSGGGTIMTSDLIANEVRKTVAAGKPVVVSMGGVAASGGYYLAAPASRIFAGPGTITGSIGVTGLYVNLSAAADKLGIKAETVLNSPSAGFANLFTPSRDEDLGRTREFILDAYERFVAVVAEGRKLDPAVVRKLGEGQVWTGREALGLGLVDELGSLDSAKAWVQAKLGGRLQYRDILPGAGMGLAGMGFDGMSVRLASAAVQAISQEVASTAGDALGSGRGLAQAIAPLAAEVQSITRLGQGPLYLFAER